MDTKVSHQLLPEPKGAMDMGGRFDLSNHVMITQPPSSSSRLGRGIGRFIADIHQAYGVRISTDFIAGTDSVIYEDCSDTTDRTQNLDDDESYALAVDPNAVRIWAKSSLGALHAFQTFEQLIQHDDKGYFVSSVSISDSPRFKWRGLMLDCSRHFEPIDVIKTNLDYMERCKLNVFHWHLSDDQGFRVESKVFPRLQALGSDGKYYTQKQIKDVIAYARDRGIRVVPEFDMPGHSTSWLVGYPDLASAPGPYAIQRHWGVFDPTIDPTRESTYTFLDKFIGEMSALFPDQYLHIGGDEVNGHQWNDNPRIQAFMKAHGMKSNADLQAYFNSRIYEIVKKHHKKMIGWDEVLQPGIPGEIAIQSWRGRDSLDHAAQLGHPAILSSGYYLDWLQPSTTYYAVDPLQGSDKLTADERGRILGGEACMWAEGISEHTAIGRIWPRAAAIAERLWSPASITDPASLERRISQFDPRTTTAEAPFHGNPIAIPGHFDIANFDIGGEGVAYHDTMDYNAGGEYRPTDDVSIADSTDKESTAAHQVEYTVAGEWLKYTVDVKSAGQYAVHIRAASDKGDAHFHFEDATHNRLGDDIVVPNTGGWQKWTTVDGVVPLPAGRQTITLVEDTGGYNLGNVEFDLK